MSTPQKVALTSRRLPGDGAQARFHLDDSFKKNARDGVKVIVDALELAARAELNISYLAIISSVVDQLIKAQDVRGSKSALVD
ncbi:hypothetical protein PENSPDRAFT_475072 [Peniophora sp. CONT]|nr:hypothetical protein PENSPDRAFT_475072 [Peniophora sp. CONT]